MFSSQIVKKKDFLSWLDSLRNGYKLIGPVRLASPGLPGIKDIAGKSHAIFREVSSSEDLFLEYEHTMLSPGKLFIYKPKEDLFKFKLEGEMSVEEISPADEKQIIAGVHPCDVHAILYLDRTFLGFFKDPHYEKRRKNTMIISLNCERVSLNCFCSSVGTGPFLKTEKGYDMLLTDFEDEYLVEIKSEKAGELCKAQGKPAGMDAFKHKSEKERAATGKLKKTINMDGLDNLFIKNIEHRVWRHTADRRCLSCTNCVMVCPTCFCYDIVDEISMDLKTATRHRQLDACQDAKFAEVHGGNFRQRRAARLRQFVTHKLNQTGQYGVPGTVGCGRCITWCPTGIDLTEMAKEIQREQGFA